MNASYFEYEYKDFSFFLRQSHFVAQAGVCGVTAAHCTSTFQAQGILPPQPPPEWLGSQTCATRPG